MDLALNNLQGLICHKNQQTKPKVLAETGIQQQKVQQFLQEELIAIRKEQLEILKTYEGNSKFQKELQISVSEFKYSPKEGITFPAFY